MRQSRQFRAFLLPAGFGLWLLLACALAFAADTPAAGGPGGQRGAGGIAVIYPELASPYRDIFNSIIAGIEEGARVPLQRYPLDARGGDAGRIAAQLRQRGTKVVIALGRQGLRATSGLDRDVEVVLGGIVSLPAGEPRGLTGISLTPDPGLLFARLKSLLPATRRVFVIYSPQHSGWLLPLAQAAARRQGLDLVAQEARDKATALRLYAAAFAVADGRRDAIWLPQDPTTVDEETLLPFVLRQAWSRGVPVFSSSFPHVRNGALFALYPDNRELGRALADQALGLPGGASPQPGLVPLQAVLTAVNLRTAAHLGLNLAGAPAPRFDFVFPEP